MKHTSLLTLHFCKHMSSFSWKPHKMVLQYLTMLLSFLMLNAFLQKEKLEGTSYLTIPRDWKKQHCIYFLQASSNKENSSDQHHFVKNSLRCNTARVNSNIY